jgi:chemotaxis protein MotA
MDFATIGGLIIGVGAVVVAYLIEGGRMSAVFQLPAMLLVIGGTIGAATITTSFATIRRVPELLRIAFFGRSIDPIRRIDDIVRLAEKARREGILGLEDDMQLIADPFFRKAVQLVIDGTEATVLRRILETEVSYIAERHRVGINLFKSLGGFSPTLGIIGTVLGLVHALSSTGDPKRMATSVAGAFIATLWGIAMANLCYLPIGDKLKLRHEQEMATLELVLEGVISIQSGDNPRLIRTKLMSFLEPDYRDEF